MNRKNALLVSALGLALAQPAAAQLKIQANGLGDAIYVPYYTVEDGRDSLLTISNSASVPTAARVLVSEAQNGQAVLVFNLYLPAYSTWSGALSAQAQGAHLTSASSVCTVPNLGPNGFDLVHFDYSENFPDGGPADFARTRIGAIEVIELGQLSGTLGQATSQHRCADVERSYIIIDGQPPNREGQFGAPTSRLSAQVQVVTVADGVNFPVPGVAISGFSTTAQDVEPGDVLPRISTPTLAAGQTQFEAETAFGLLRFAGDRGPDAISSLFMQGELLGEFYDAPGLGASTRWVVSFPTKHAYVSALPGSLAASGVAAPPFSDYFDATGACEPIATEQRELKGTTRDRASPEFEDGAVDLCHQINQIDFDEGADGIVQLGFGEETGRVLQAQRPDGSVVHLHGLPVVGVQMSNFINGQAQPGVLANYSIAQPLRAVPAELSSP